MDIIPSLLVSVSGIAFILLGFAVLFGNDSALSKLFPTASQNPRNAVRKYYAKKHRKLLSIIYIMTGLVIVWVAFKALNLY
ncbi:MAG: hypothetical protein US51_C0032G0004 [Microgenomates group bacterium GW2011_GWA2_37_6]|nr:MAG: hypothetical protein US51_C0032G0004 [Microgenomates group bacterium GW2011_GWA2_37_6]